MSLLDKTGVEIVTACCNAEYRWGFCVIFGVLLQPMAHILDDLVVREDFQKDTQP